LPLASTPLDAALGAGSAVDIVGYGATDPKSPTGNTKRRAYSTTLSMAALANGNVYPATDASALAAASSAMTGVACQGDDGGPWLVTSGGMPYVVGVTSVFDCAGGSVATRVSSVLSFVNTNVATPCELCQMGALTGGGACEATLASCQSDPGCMALMTLCGCPTSDGACIQGCFEAHAGVPDAKYGAVLGCLCNTACTTACAAELCSVQACGFTYVGTKCASCVDSQCCAQSDACSKDASCTSCLTAETPSCGQSAVYSSFKGCVDSHCASACTPGGAGGAGGAGGVGGGGAAGGAGKSGAAGVAGGAGKGGNAAAGGAGAGGNAAGASGGSGGSAGIGGNPGTGGVGGVGGVAGGSAGGGAGKGGSSSGGSPSASGGNGGVMTAGKGGATSGSGGRGGGAGAPFVVDAASDAPSGASGGCSVGGRGVAGRGLGLALMAMMAIVRRRRGRP
jgi:hypothetical protein